MRGALPAYNAAWRNLNWSVTPNIASLARDDGKTRSFIRLGQWSQGVVKV
jgi:hypothetical protein